MGAEMTNVATLRAPFPWFGGKSRVASMVWERFGDVQNYVEPFFGSGAVLLARPHEPRTETVNDRDGFVANFWRAVQHAPEQTARFADWPVNEADLHARHRWLLSQRSGLYEAILRDPDWFDPKIAGWWVWGLCAWIGDGWCSSSATRGLPHLGNAGRGIHRASSDARQLFLTLAERMRRVRVACGDWSRVVGDSITFWNGTTGVFLDPPYPETEHSVEYAGGGDVAVAVRDWAVENAGNSELRIALCGYDGAYEMPDEWECIPWKTRGGYGSQGDGRGRENAERERIWFSPACLKPERQQRSLFDVA